jgi:hypothetical protein
MTAHAMIVTVEVKEKTVQDAPGAIFPRGVATWVSPLFELAPVTACSSGRQVLKLFARSKTMWTLTSCGRKERAHRIWKSRKEREIPTAPTSIISSSSKEKNEEQNDSSQLSTKSDRPQRERRGPHRKRVH